MLGFRSKVITGVLLIIAIILVCGAFYISYNRHMKKSESYPHTISIYSEEGDTLLDMDTESEYVKIWIEEDGKLDIWTLEESGWIRK